MSTLQDLNVHQLIIEINNEDEMAESVVDNTSYRRYARYKALQVWKDHSLWGVGPGMFGGDIAVKHRSPVYEEYNFSSVSLNEYHDLDQFWPQALAELGIIGVMAFVVFSVSLLVIFFIARQRTNSDEMKNLFIGLILFTVFNLINTLSSSLNIISILYPYSAFVGIGLGSSRLYNDNYPHLNI